MELLRKRSSFFVCSLSGKRRRNHHTEVINASIFVKAHYTFVMEKLQFTSLEEVLKQLDILEQSESVTTTNWSAYKILQHCAQTIDYSMTGYPQYKPKWFRATIGRLVLSKFLKQGFMKHNLSAPVPGSPILTKEGTTGEGIVLLRNTIERFRNFKGELKPHLIFGKLTREQYDHYFAMHVADHLSEVNY